MYGRWMLAVLVVLAAPASAADAVEPEGPSFPDVAGALADGARAAAGAASASGRAVAAGASAVGDGVALTFTLLAGAAAAVVRGVASAAGAVAAFAALLGALVADAARFLAAHPKESLVGAAAVGGATAATGAAMWLRRVGLAGALAPLYTRLAPEDVLENRARQATYEHIRAHPGAHPREIAAAVGIGWGTVVYHLSRLESTGLVSATKRGTMKCYFASGVTPVADRKALAAVKHPTAQAIATYVRSHPHARQKDVAAALGLSAALVSWHVGKLEDAGVLSRARSGRATALVAAVAEPAVA